MPDNVLRPEEVEPDECAAVRGAEEIRERLADMLRDESRLEGGDVHAVYFPTTTAQVVWALRDASQAGRKITVSCARTGIVAGAVPVPGETGCILSLSKMTKCSEVTCDKTGVPHISLEAGVTLDELNKTLDSLSGESRFLYPPDSTEATASLGGNAATDASGSRSFHYGPTRRWVRALTVVLLDGRVLRLRRGDVCAERGVLKLLRAGGVEDELTLPEIRMLQTKNAAGYFMEPNVDAVDLFVGSEGTLGVITELELRLVKDPDPVLAMVAFYGEKSNALDLVAALRSDSELQPIALEYFDSNSLDFVRKAFADTPDASASPPTPARSALFFEIPYKDEDELEMVAERVEGHIGATGGSIDDTWAGFEEREIERMRKFRHVVPETINSVIASRQKDLPSLHKVGTDLAVPDSAFAEMVAFYRSELASAGLEHAVFGHAGDNHLHVNMLPRNPEELALAKQLYVRFAQKAVELGGSVSAEHGIGRLKTHLLELQYGKEGVDGMLRVKEFFDPDGALNPGVMFGGAA